MGFWLQDRMISWVKIPLKHLLRSCPGGDYTTLGIFRTFTEQGKAFPFYKVVTFSTSLTPVEDHSLPTAPDYYFGWEE